MTERPPITQEERSALLDKMDRMVKRARSYVKSSEELMYWWLYRTEKQQPALGIPTEYWTLIEQMLDTAEAITKALPDDIFIPKQSRSFMDGSPFVFDHGDYMIGERLRDLAAVYEQRCGKARRMKRIEALENVTGRSPEEAAAFLAKAQELREQEG